MADRLTSVGMRAFRGVPHELSVEFPTGSSAVLFGDNATGKSTVADAIEWYFTGQIDLLRPEGRRHAIRHIGAPEGVATQVTIETTGSLGGALVLDGPISPAALEAGRETFLLRGRTLTAFVESTKGEKWRALAEILGLEAVDQLRRDLQRARNELREKSVSAERDHTTAAQGLASKAASVNEDGILQAISDLCRRAEIAPPALLGEALDPRWSASIAAASPGTSHAVELGTLAADLEAASSTPLATGGIDTWNQALSSEPELDQARLRFFQAADSLLQTAPATGRCPLCGQEVNEENLAQQVQVVLETLRASAQRAELASEGVRALADRVDEARRRELGFRDRAGTLGISLPMPPASTAGDLRQAITDHRPANAEAIGGFEQSLAEWHAEAREAVGARVKPAPSPREGLLVELGVLAQQARTWRDAAGAVNRARRAAEAAEKVFKAYEERQAQYFKDILDRISGRVAGIYTRLHPGEQLEEVCIEPWGAKGIELAVSFHGSRQKPPHGVLSESHLNSLAVALFLAMAETFNEQLDFMVLDDVVNSFDNEHRGELAALLATEYTNRQLIVLTHDHLFCERLCRLAPSWRRIEFTSWDFDEGPRTATYMTGEMLEKARVDLDAGDLVGAAMKGRRALEELLQEICEGLQAPLAFRRGVKNDRREIGELFTGLRRVVRDASKPAYEALTPLLDRLGADVAAALNVEAHASKERVSPAEVRAALDRIGDLGSRWTCPDCSTRVWHMGIPTLCQCRCGRTRFPPAPDTDT